MAPQVRRRGLVVGKFLPPHAGHHHVIDRALADCTEVDVVVCDLDGQVPPASVRAAWLAEIHPAATVTVVPDICGWHGADPCPPPCSAAWADHLRRHGLGPWDAVYGSEPYVERFSPLVGAVPVLVDVDRSRHPVSGTVVRADLAANWHHLHPVVRAGLTRRVVVLGAESTGTTTLAADLAARLGVPWVPEYGRQFSEQRAEAAGSIWDVTWTTADFHHVAERQERLEADTIGEWVADPDRSRPQPVSPVGSADGPDSFPPAAPPSSLVPAGPAAPPGWPALLGPVASVVVCDTDVLATAVWHRRYCGTLADELVDRARRRPPLLYVLTSPDRVRFEQDGLRDGEHVRDEMTGWFREVLSAGNTPWIEVSGPPTARVDAVVDALEQQATGEDDAGPLVRAASSGRHATTPSCRSEAR